jgi:hypothetical protein
VPPAASHPFYRRLNQLPLNQLLREHGVDAVVEAQCAGFYAATMGPSLPPGIYFPLLLISYSQGIDSGRAIAWRAADSCAPTCDWETGLSLLKITQRSLRDQDITRDRQMHLTRRTSESTRVQRVPRLLIVRVVGVTPVLVLVTGFRRERHTP